MKTNKINIHLDFWTNNYFIIIFLTLAWLYWLIIAITTPITLWDSNTYNIARLEIASRGGLFSNNTFNDPRQIFMSWSFDSIHLIFEKLDFANALPSFLCYTGIIIIYYKLIKNYYNIRCANLFCMFMFSMPCLLYQATSTKPDLAVFFFLSCWLYAFLYYRNTHYTIFLILNALSLALAFGSKMTGIPFVIIASIYTIYYLYKNSRIHLFFYIFYYIILFLLFSSIETYLNNIILYNNILGPQYYLKLSDDTNLIIRTFASCIRRLFDNTSLGYESFIHNSVMKKNWENICHKLMALLKLTDKGIVKTNFFETNESSMQFQIDGSESNSDYGIIGCLGLWLSLIITILYYFIKDRIRYLALLTISYFCIVNGIIGWGPWSNRYSLGAFILSSVTLAIIIGTAKNIYLYRFISILAFISIIATPLYSFNRNPRAIREFISNRSISQLYENQLLIPIYSDLQNLIKKYNVKSLYICAGKDAWILPFLKLKDINIIILPNINNINDIRFVKPNSILLILNNNLPRNYSFKHFNIINKYLGSWSTKESAIYINN